MANNNIKTQEEYRRVLISKTKNTKLNKAFVEQEKEFKFAIYCRNSDPKKALTKEQMIKFLNGSKEFLNKKNYPYLYTEKNTKKDKFYLETVGKGYKIPVPNKISVMALINLLTETMKQKKITGISLEMANHGPCEDGRDTKTEWKYFPPKTTMESVKQLVEDFGIVKNVTQTDKCYQVTYSGTFSLLHESSIILSQDKEEGWFQTIEGKPTLCRFVSRRRCTLCGTKGHHTSRCPPDFAENAKNLLAAFGKSKNQPSKSKNQNPQSKGKNKIEKKASGNSNITGVDSVDSSPSSDGTKSPLHKKAKVDKESLLEEIPASPSDFISKKLDMDDVNNDSFGDTVPFSLTTEAVEGKNIVSKETASKRFTVPPNISISNFK